jgi:hypothetical protein
MYNENKMNFILEHTKNMKIDIIEINTECCVCLDFLDIDVHTLKCCCNEIHIKCIYEMFVCKPIINDKVIFTCPLCRKQDDFKNIISLKEIKKYTRNYDIINKYKLQKKFNYYQFEKYLKFIIGLICISVIIYLLHTKV